jgi:hypothetical protein
MEEKVRADCVRFPQGPQRAKLPIDISAEGEHKRTETKLEEEGGRSREKIVTIDSNLDY